MKQAFIDSVIDLTLDASDTILSVYQKNDCQIKLKPDQSPVTEADLAAHHILIHGLRQLSDLPILSEESTVIEYEKRAQWHRYWLVDPLDGTKEFIHRNGEFTVNVALIEGNRPIFGVVTVPLSGIVYWGDIEKGAFKIENERSVPLKTRAIDNTKQSVDIVASRRHGADKLALLDQQLNASFTQVNYHSMGSSLKLCLIAEGKADLYPRFAPTCEWDTAAAQAVVEVAGGGVVDASSLQSLRYNTKDSLLNPYFYVFGDKNYAWNALLQKIPAE